MITVGSQKCPKNAMVLASVPCQVVESGALAACQVSFRVGSFVEGKGADAPIAAEDSPGTV